MRPPRNFGNPGAFDYRRFLARQDIYWTVSAAAGTVRVLPGHCGNAFQKAVMDLRQAALARIEQLYHGDAYQSGMMQAILIGQSFQMQKVWTEQYRPTGTFHVIVISGTHVAVLAAFFLFMLRICFVPESVALFVTVLAAWLYALVTGWQAPCVRSAAGLTLFMIAGYFFRERRIMNLLAAVALGFLLLDPDQLFEASFQLTFLAVGFLARSLHRPSPPPRDRWPRDFATWPIPGAIFTCTPARRSSASRCACWPRRCARRCGWWRGRPAWCSSFTRSCSFRRWCNSGSRCPWWSTFTAWASRDSRRTPSWCR